jgi:regulator of protease activity HflC (stomatin/prohibitin superfamily)
MVELNDREKVGVPSGRRSGMHESLLLGAGAMAALAALCAGLFAGRNTIFPALGIPQAVGSATGLYALTALAIQWGLAALAAFSALSAGRVAARYHRAERLAQRDAAAREGSAGGSPRSPKRWSQGELADPDEDLTFDVAQGDADHARKLHYLVVMVIPLGAALLGMLWLYLRMPGTADPNAYQGQAVALGILAMAASCVWLVLSRSFASLPEDELPEAMGLVMAFRESQWASLLVAAGVVGSLAWASLELWTTRLLLAWIALVAAEDLGRAVYHWVKGPKRGKLPVPVVDLVSRRAVLVRGNPVSSLFEMIEARYGVSFRSSWAIRFVRRAATPLAFLAGLLFWGMSCLSMVGPSEMAVREDFGKRCEEPLGPGLHFKLPWPMGQVRRFPVKTVFMRPVGFDVEDGVPAGKGKKTPVVAPAAASEQLKDFRSPRAYLWTKSHGAEEFALVLGSGSEVVAVNALVYYKIREDRDGFFDFVYHFQNPVDALVGYAYRALMEKTRGATLAEVLSTNRMEFARALQAQLRKYAVENRLGIDVVEVALVNLHPPVEAAPDYLDVINARNDAARAQIEAAGKQKIDIHSAETFSGTAVASEKVDAAKRVGTAYQETAEFTAVGNAYSVDPEGFRLRMRGDVLQDVLSKKPFVLVDKSLSTTLDARGSTGRSDSLPVGENTP